MLPRRGELALWLFCFNLSSVKSWHGADIWWYGLVCCGFLLFFSLFLTQGWHVFPYCLMIGCMLCPSLFSFSLPTLPPSLPPSPHPQPSHPVSHFLIYQQFLWILFANSVQEWSLQTLSFLIQEQLSKNCLEAFSWWLISKPAGLWSVQVLWMLHQLWCLLCEPKDKQYKEKWLWSLM